MIAQTPLRCFSYARCSTDKQDKSIARQNREMGQDARRVNCQIVRRFDDEAVSGAKTHQRPGFLAMMEAAKTEDIDAILVENSNRFGRFDSLEAGKWLQPLQERGIVLVSLTERTFDFNSEFDRAFFLLNQDLSNNKYLSELAYRVSSQMLENAKQGRVNGAIPWGYERMLCDPQGNHVRILEPGERKPIGEKYRGYYCVPVITSDNEILEAIRWIYETFANSTMNMNELARELNRRKTRTPRKATKNKNPRWTKQGVRIVLNHPEYTGKLLWNRRHCGSHQGIIDGEVTAHHKIARANRGSRRANSWYHDEDQWIVLDRPELQIIESDLYERCQKKQQRTSRRKTRFHSDYRLSGLLYCGHCETLLAAYTQNSIGKYKMYRCRGAADGVCQRFAVHESDMVSILKTHLCDLLLSPKRLEEIRKHFKSRLTAQVKGTAPRVNAIKRDLQKVETDIQKATDQLINVSSRHIHLVEKRIDELDARRKQLQNELGDIQTLPEGSKIDAHVGRMLAKLTEMAAWLESEDIELQRRLFREAYHSVKIWFEEHFYGDQKRYYPSHYEIRFRDFAPGATDPEPMRFDWPESLKTRKIPHNPPQGKRQMR